MTSFALWGTIVNTVTVLGGALLGLLIRRGLALIRAKRGEPAERADKPAGKNLSAAVMGAVGLCVVLIGIDGALKVKHILVMIVSMALGTLIGSFFDLDGLVCRAASFVERRIGAGSGTLAEGFVTAAMVFCVGAMTVTGALESGILHTHSTYYAKAMLDMVSATVFASTLGAGVAFSALAVFAVQGLLTGAAVLVADAIPLAITDEVMAVGSLLVVGIGLNLMGVTKFKIMNFLPAMLLPFLLCPLFELLGIG